MRRYYWLLLRRATSSTLEHAREHLVRLAITLILFAIAGSVATYVLSRVDHGSAQDTKKLADDLSANYGADASVTVGFLLLGGALLFLWNVVKMPAVIDSERLGEIQDLRVHVEGISAQLDDVLKDPTHIAHLKNALRLVPNGRTGSLIEDALREHLPDTSIWAEQERLRVLVNDAVDGRATAQERLTNELNAGKLVGALSMLSQRLRAATDFPMVNAAPDLKRWANGFPDLDWSVVDLSKSTMRKQGQPRYQLSLSDETVSYPIAYIDTFEGACQAVTAVRTLWDAIPAWPEVARVIGAELKLPEARNTLDRHIAELSLHPQFPGRCRLCSPKPVRPSKPSPWP
jgi:hypothetical protein